MNRFDSISRSLAPALPFFARPLHFSAYPEVYRCRDCAIDLVIADAYLEKLPKRKTDKAVCLQTGAAPCGSRRVRIQKAAKSQLSLGRLNHTTNVYSLFEFEYSVKFRAVQRLYVVQLRIS